MQSESYLFSDHNVSIGKYLSEHLVEMITNSFLLQCVPQMFKASFFFPQNPCPAAQLQTWFRIGGGGLLKSRWGFCPSLLSTKSV